MNAIKVKKFITSRRPLVLAAAGLVALAVAAPGAVHAQSTVIPQTVLELLGVMKLRQMCYDRCGDELNKDIDFCNKTYPDLAFDPRWGDCVGEALAVYYRCTEDCPPKEKIIENPFGQ